LKLPQFACIFSGRALPQLLSGCPARLPAVLHPVGASADVTATSVKLVVHVLPVAPNPPAIQLVDWSYDAFPGSASGSQLAGALVY